MIPHVLPGGLHCRQPAGLLARHMLRRPARDRLEALPAAALDEAEAGRGLATLRARHEHPLPGQLVEQEGLITDVMDLVIALAGAGNVELHPEFDRLGVAAPQ